VTGTYPCIFQVGTSFYDYTFFKLGAQSQNNGWMYAINQNNSTQYVYSWCQQLSEIPASPC
jgi:hypothetical protein